MLMLLMKFLLICRSTVSGQETGREAAWGALLVGLGPRSLWSLQLNSTDCIMILSTCSQAACGHGHCIAVSHESRLV